MDVSRPGLRNVQWYDRDVGDRSGIPGTLFLVGFGCGMYYNVFVC